MADWLSLQGDKGAWETAAGSWGVVTETVLTIADGGVMDIVGLDSCSSLRAVHVPVSLLLGRNSLSLVGKL